MPAVLAPTPPAPRLGSVAAPTPYRWTRAEYYRLGELGFFQNKRVELIRGEIVEMSPKGWPHVVAVRKTAGVLEAAFVGIGWVARQEPVNLTDSEPEPDVAVVRGRFEDFADHPTTAALIVEVADTSLFYDTTTKAGLYAEMAIPDYWVVDVEHRQLLVFRDPAPVAAGGAAYRTHLTLGPDATVSPLAAPAASIRVADLLP
jgi:Uma2 family endonuclease